MTTPALPTLNKRIADATDAIIKKQVTPWAFMPSGKPFKIQKHDGSLICYEGIHFEGSPRAVFWGRYIEPFIEEMVLQEIEQSMLFVKENNLDARQVLAEVQELLISSVNTIFQEMARIDQLLLGNGYPERIPLRPVAPEIEGMHAFIQEHIQAELAMWKQQPRLYAWWGKYKCWFKILVGAGTIFGGIVTGLEKWDFLYGYILKLLK